jgi:hypothetical protein
MKQDDGKRDYTCSPTRCGYDGEQTCQNCGFARAEKIAHTPIGRSYVDIGRVGDGSGESLLDGDFIHGARHYRDITNDTRQTIDRLLSAESQRDELLEALKQARGALYDVSQAYQDFFEVMPVSWQTYDHIVEEAKKASDAAIAKVGQGAS